MKPEWCPQEIWDEAGTVVRDSLTVTVYHAAIANALLEAHQRGRREGMEEAAKVVDALSEQWAIEWRGTLKANDQLESMSDGADMAAAAIRAKAKEVSS